jgi:hypothetical protein
MHEIKPTWAIAQEISRRHAMISLKIMLPILLSTIVLAIFVLKIVGYHEPGVVLRQFFLHNKSTITSIILFIHFIPINFYAVKRVFYENFGTFQIKIISKEL